MGQANEEQNPCAQNLKQIIQLSNYGTHHSKTIIYVTEIIYISITVWLVKIIATAVTNI